MGAVLTHERPTTPKLLRLVRAVHERERSLCAALNDQQIRCSSALPGWTRGHVVASRRAFLRAALRQFDYALRGDSIDFYDGGRVGRDDAIEDWAGRPAEELVTDMLAATTAFERTMDQLQPRDWDRAATYRGPGTLYDVLLGDWREAEIHHVDLGLGQLPSSWSVDFCVHLFCFLRPRVPDSLTLELDVSGGESFRLGSGEHTVRLSAPITDLAAWLAGRPPDRTIHSSTGALPQLQRLRDGARSSADG